MTSRDGPRSEPIRISRVEVHGSRVSADVHAGSAAKYLRSGEFWVDFGDVDVSAVDASVAVIPVLGTILPVAFASGARVVVERVDREFAEAATDLSRAFGSLYPRFRSDEFEIQGERRDQTLTSTDHRGVLLYSGGLDAAASLAGHQEALAALAVVRGADVPLGSEHLWSGLMQGIRRSTANTSAHLVTVTSNFRDFPEDKRLNRDFIRDPSPDWWGRVHHGLGLVALLAPLTHVLGAANVYIASSHSPRFAVPWGSSPQTDPLIRWSSVRCVHDGFELTRQGKIRARIAPYLLAGGELTLRVCGKPSTPHGALNCGECEKCIRTASGLIVEGIDPRRVDLLVTQETLGEWRARVASGSRRLGPNELFMWTDVQEGALSSASPLDGYEEYCRWLRTFDFRSVSRPEGGLGRRLKTSIGFIARDVLDVMPRTARDRVRSFVSSRRRA